MNSLLRLAATFAAGAAAMYFLDPNAGRRRRATARDRTMAARHDAEHYARGKLRRVADRAQGMAAEARARVEARPVSDDRLRERVRARLGHLVERSSAVEVSVVEGKVVLRGEALEEEFGPLHKAVSRMPGVTSVESLLTPRAPDAGSPRPPAQQQPEASPQQPH